MAGNQLRAAIVIRTLLEMSSYDEHGVNQGHSETIGLCMSNSSSDGTNDSTLVDAVPASPKGSLMASTDQCTDSDV